ncbi:hypothetical protein GQ42DRAFT_163349 [Ramicandelaber brevisporus]|nr:hypothetical protein GQ42DRAFT_163349 [Ramicandelaber brevisporus]
MTNSPTTTTATITATTATTVPASLSSASTLVDDSHNQYHTPLTPVTLLTDSAQVTASDTHASMNTFTVALPQPRPVIPLAATRPPTASSLPTSSATSPIFSVLSIPATATSTAEEIISHNTDTMTGLMSLSGSRSAPSRSPSRSSMSSEYSKQVVVSIPSATPLDALLHQNKTLQRLRLQRNLQARYKAYQRPSSSSSSPARPSCSPPPSSSSSSSSHSSSSSSSSSSALSLLSSVESSVTQLPPQTQTQTQTQNQTVTASAVSVTLAKPHPQPLFRNPLHLPKRLIDHQEHQRRPRAHTAVMMMAHPFRLGSDDQTKMYEDLHLLDMTELGDLQLPAALSN